MDYLNPQKIGNLYKVKMLDEKGELWVYGYFVAYGPPGATKKALAWFRSEFTDNKPFAVGSVKLVANDVIQ